MSKELLEERIANLENVLMGHRKELEFMEEGDDMYDRVVEQVIHEVKNSSLATFQHIPSQLNRLQLHAPIADGRNTMESGRP